MRFPPNPKRLVRERHNCHYVLRWRSNARFTMKGLLVTRKPSLPPVFHPILYLPDRGRLWILIHGYTPTPPTPPVQFAQPDATAQTRFVFVVHANAYFASGSTILRAYIQRNPARLLGPEAVST